MKRITILICAVFATLVIAVTSSAEPILMNGWIDTEKTVAVDDDTLLCWAASSANILEYTGWVGAPKLSTAAEIFADYKWFWNDNNGNTAWGVEWWFDGVNKGKDFSNAAQLTNTTHTGFYSTQLFEENHGYQKLVNETFETQISDYVDNEMGISLLIGYYNAKNERVNGHWLTLWGIDIVYNEIFVTDSDRDLNTLSTYNYDNNLVLNNYPGQPIMEQMFGLARRTADDPAPKPRPVPEPSTMLLLGVGLAGFIWVNGKFRSR